MTTVTSQDRRANGRGVSLPGRAWPARHAGGVPLPGGPHMIRRSRLFGIKTRVTFSIPGDQPAGDVSVVGTFNDWTPGRHQLMPRRNGTRSVSVILPPGEHRFRYL